MKTHRERIQPRGNEIQSKVTVKKLAKKKEFYMKTKRKNTSKGTQGIENILKIIVHREKETSQGKKGKELYTIIKL